MLEPSKAPVGAAQPDDTSLIFCIDISGSMCVTTECEATTAPAAADSLAKRQESARLNPEGVQQRLPRERKDMCYVSRLAAVQTALRAQIDAMARNQCVTHTPSQVFVCVSVCVQCLSERAPLVSRVLVATLILHSSQRKIGLVTFSSEVEIIGDGSGDPVTIAGDALNSYDAVIAAGEAYALQQPVHASKERLWGKIKVRLCEGYVTV